MENSQVIAVWVISNSASLNVWEMNNDEAMFVGINNDEPEWCEIEYEPDEEGDGFVAGIYFGGRFYKLDECMRVNRP